MSSDIKQHGEISLGDYLINGKTTQAAEHDKPNPIKLINLKKALAFSKTAVNEGR